MRDLKKAEPLRARAAAEKVELDIRQLDVCDDASVSACIGEVLAKYGRIDVLVNNAGAGYFGSLEQTPIAEARNLFEVNFFGVWRTCAAVLPAMRAARAGRIINVTSLAGMVANPFADAYCASKFAVEGMSESLAAAVASMGITVSLVEPGPVVTEFMNNASAKPITAPNELDALYQPMMMAFFNSFAGIREQITQSGEDVAKTILQAATDETPHMRYVTSEWVAQMAKLKFHDLQGDEAVRAMSAAFR
jgi:NAD(P)-dependent dehydrogenase (short-subunit alcohol dehydrogenase family)